MTLPVPSYVGKVDKVLLCPPGSKRSVPQKSITVRANFGVVGDSHSGSDRLLDIRETELLALGLPKGLPIANLRQFSATSVEELDKIATALQLANIAAGELVENLVVRDIPGFTQLPEHTKLMFGTSDNKRLTVLEVKAENQPCIVVGDNLAETYSYSLKMNVASHFPKAAEGLRGVVGIVQVGGTIKTGDSVYVFLP